MLRGSHRESTHARFVNVGHASQSNMTPGDKSLETHLVCRVRTFPSSLFLCVFARAAQKSLSTRRTRRLHGRVRQTSRSTQWTFSKLVAWRRNMSTRLVGAQRVCALRVLQRPRPRCAFGSTRSTRHRMRLSPFPLKPNFILKSPTRTLLPFATPCSALPGEKRRAGVATTT